MGKDKINTNILRARLENLESYWNKFQANHDKLLSVKSDQPDNEYFKDNMYDLVEDKYIETKAQLWDYLDFFTKLKGEGNKSQISNESIVMEQRPARNFPQLEIPKFSGVITEWPSFRDLFKSMIHSDGKMPSVQKLHYLKVSLSNEPAQLIANISITDDNFDRAWKILIDRYDNERLLVNNYLNRLFSLKSVSKESAVNLRILLNDTVEIVGALKVLKRPTDSWDDLLVFMTVQRLDPTTRKSWEDQLGSSTTYPTFDELGKFLTSKLITLETLQTTDVLATKYNITKTTTGDVKAQRGNPSIRVHNASTKDNLCVLCDSKHPILFCPIFRAKVPEERKELVRQFHLCFNCLGKHHIKVCNSPKRCQKCNRPHHTMLHLQFNPSSQRTEETSLVPTSSPNRSNLNPSANVFPNPTPSAHVSSNNAGEFSENR